MSNFIFEAVADVFVAVEVWVFGFVLQQRTLAGESRGAFEGGGIGEKSGPFGEGVGLGFGLTGFEDGDVGVEKEFVVRVILVTLRHGAEVVRDAVED